MVIFHSFLYVYQRVSPWTSLIIYIYINNLYTSLIIENYLYIYIYYLYTFHQIVIKFPMARLLSYVLEELLQRDTAANDQPPASVVQQVQKLHEAAHLVEMAMDIPAFLRCVHPEKCHENHGKIWRKWNMPWKSWKNMEKMKYAMKIIKKWRKWNMPWKSWKKYKKMLQTGDHFDLFIVKNGVFYRVKNAGISPCSRVFFHATINYSL